MQRDTVESECNNIKYLRWLLPKPLPVVSYLDRRSYTSLIKGAIIDRKILILNPPRSLDISNCFHKR